MALHDWLTWLKVRSGRDSESGQGGLEYALVAGVVIVAIITAFTAFPVGSIVTDSLNAVAALVPGGGG